MNDTKNCVTVGTCVKFSSSSRTTDTFPTSMAEKSGIFPSYKHKIGVNMKQLKILLPYQGQVSDSSLEKSEHSVEFGLYSPPAIEKCDI